MRTSTLAIVLLAALVACGNEKETSGGADATKSSVKSDQGVTPAASAEPVKATEPEKPTPTAPKVAPPVGLLGCRTPDPAAAPPAKGALPFALTPCPTIPSVYGSIAFGMDAATARKAAKGFKVDDSSGRMKIGKQWLHFHLSDAGKVEDLSFSTSAAGVAAMTAAWGPALEVKSLSDTYQDWYNPTAKIKVRVSPNIFADEGDESETFAVRYSPYTPLTDIVGPGGLLSKKIIGATAEELHATFPDWLEVTTEEQAKAETAALGLDDPNTKEILDWAGVNEASISLELPQSEASNHLSVSLEWSGKKVDSYRLILDCGENQAMKTETIAQVLASLGAPTRATPGDKGDWSYTWAGPGGAKIELDTGEGVEWMHLKVTK